MTYPFDCITDLIFTETEIEPADLILIPGGSHPQPMEKAAGLYHQGLAPYLLPSGGYNSKIGQIEWNFMREIGLKQGVPGTAILKEDQARNTFDNARTSWEVIQEADLKIRSVIMVCKAHHSRRALMSYQTVFPRRIKFMVVGVLDHRRISRENWFLEEGKIHR